VKLEQVKEVSDAVCREFDVKRLDIFGSIARGMDSASSDVDLIVEFRNPEDRPAKRFFGLLHRFEDALGCHVDLLTLDSLRNPYFRKRVLSERIPLYEG
jgi:predicted nucleotidyltransferase